MSTVLEALRIPTLVALLLAMMALVPILVHNLLRLFPAGMMILHPRWKKCSHCGDLVKPWKRYTTGDASETMYFFDLHDECGYCEVRIQKGMGTCSHSV